MNEFEKWLASPPYDLPESGFEKHDEYGMWPGQYRKYDVQIASEAWRECAAQKQGIIDKQADELAALREFANELLTDDIGCDGHPFINEMLIKHNLIDENGNPTPLLTGINEDATDD